MHVDEDKQSNTQDNVLTNSELVLGVKSLNNSTDCDVFNPSEALGVKIRDGLQKTIPKPTGSSQNEMIQESMASTTSVQGPKSLRKLFSWRYSIVALLHLTFLMAVFARNSMGMALVCMSSPTSNKDINNTQVTSNMSDTSDDQHYEFSWDAETQGLVLSSASFLSCLSPIITNYISQYIGYKTTLGISCFVIGAIQMVMPVTARAGTVYLIGLRFFLGITFGSNVPAVGDCVSKWAPDDEKQTMITFIFTGLQTGDVVCNIVSGYLCTIPIDNGWPFIFYFIGFLHIAWVILWQIFASIRPEDHKYLSQEELNYILNNRKLSPSNGSGKKKNENPPYKAVFTSIPFIALMMCQASLFWSYSLFFSYLPLYLASLLRYPITTVGIVMTVFGVFRFLGMAAFTALINGLFSHTKWNGSRIKKLVLFIGMTVTIGVQILIIFIPTTHKRVILGALFATMFFQSSAGCILPAVPLDLAPRYGGYLSGVLFAAGSLGGLAAPLMVAALTPNGTEEEWRIVWIVLAILYASIIVIFTLFVDCSIQPWAQSTGQETKLKVVASFDQSIAVQNTPPVLIESPNSNSIFNFTRGIENSNPLSFDSENRDVKQYAQNGKHDEDLRNRGNGQAMSNVLEWKNQQNESIGNSNGKENAGYVSDEKRSSSSVGNNTDKGVNDNIIIYRL